MNRKTFLKQSIGVGALAILSPWYIELKALNTSERLKGLRTADDLFFLLVQSNDLQVEILLREADPKMPGHVRALGYQFGVIAASYCTPKSKYFHHQDLINYLNIICKWLLSVQGDDGTINVGNLESPPDTAFLVELLCAGMSVLRTEDSDDLYNIKEEVKIFLLKAGEALVIGGVHTPNHRWVICSALARLHSLYPNERYTKRIHDWLGEGVYIDNDGHFPERSMIYSEVVDRSLITVARLMDMPELLEPVRKNLEMTYYYMDPGGDLATVDSRRQDQYKTASISSYYLHYRYMAIHDHNRGFAGVAKYIEDLFDFRQKGQDLSLLAFMEIPLLQNELPEASNPPVSYEKLFKTSSLARIRRDAVSMTIFGGTDWPLIISSGRSTSPNFFSYRRGAAILNYMRLSARFFSMGYFRSEGLEKKDDKYVLYCKWEVPYYQPLPANKRRVDGNYELTPSVDDRFWNKMSFSDRPVSNVKILETTIAIREDEGKAGIEIEVAGENNVEVTLELCFGEGGKLFGVNEANGEENYFLERGMGRYQFGKDVISIGPGNISHQNIERLESEKYRVHNGSLRTDGMHVYITGITPFRHLLTFE